MCVCVCVDNWVCSFFRWQYEFFAFICLEHRPHTSVTVCLHRNINKCGIIIGLISIGFYLCDTPDAFQACRSLISSTISLMCLSIVGLGPLPLDGRSSFEVLSV